MYISNRKNSMDYTKHYNKLVDRARNRHLDYFTESHHIMPRCMGGNDLKCNLVDLTPEEHYVAHQLLVKMHPNNGALVKAATMMIPNRPSNKMYGWLKRKLSNEMKISQGGVGNSQYGTRWIHSDEGARKIPKLDVLPVGWFEGRVSLKEKICVGCGNTYKSKCNKKFCADECRKINRKPRNDIKPRLEGRELEFLRLVENNSIHKSLILMGVKNGNACGTHIFSINTLASVTPLVSTQ